MTDACQPPDGTADGTWHWLSDGKDITAAEWTRWLDWPAWKGGIAEASIRPNEAARYGWRYVGPVALPAEVDALKAENARLRNGMSSAAAEIEAGYPEHARDDLWAALATLARETPDAS